jgi:hypothetical protein
VVERKHGDLIRRRTTDGILPSAVPWFNSTPDDLTEENNDATKTPAQTHTPAPSIGVVA